MLALSTEMNWNVARPSTAFSWSVPVMCAGGFALASVPIAIWTGSVAVGMKLLNLSKTPIWTAGVIATLAVTVAGGWMTQWSWADGAGATVKLLLLNVAGFVAVLVAWSVYWPV